MQITDLAYIDATGYHYADYPSFLTWLQDSYRGIYGADVYLESDSQDGQFLAVLAKAFFDTAALGASNYNSFSPISAQGTGLARNVKINGIQKKVASNSTANLLVVGTAGTIITNGIAADTLGNKWDLPTTVTIPGGGSITVVGTCEVKGAITADANTINKIFTPTIGWQSVNNASAAAPGNSVETDGELRIRQSKSTANPSLTVIEGTYGAIENLTGVTKVMPYENKTDSTDGNGLPPHSISMSVLGGSNADVAQAIFLHKTPGCNTYGSTSVTVYDSKGLPNVMNFNRPAQAVIWVRLTLSVGNTWTNDYKLLIQNSVAAFINAIDIDGLIVWSRLFNAAYSIGVPASQSYQIEVLEIKKGAGAFVQADINLGFNEYAFTDPLVNVTFV